MKYIIKNTMTGEYLRSGNLFFVWTNDIYFAKVFKGIKSAQNNINDIEQHCKTMGQYYREGGKKEYYYVDLHNNKTLLSKIKIMGVELKEFEI